ncbi:cyclohexanecarboxylate-CoA ligase [Sphingopyxis sp. YF1]|uniref:AMP-binding protein n=1 Tax=Sphingopyxis sp. YF1 TaxID=2482763 RepID=UPI001F601335|nr:AMP-binding protein [Sphingopyxis sp. YF1]UNU43729.1 cyclohexanecarboxylate-CoA ligase [Sphingopyxis sp. YF1]
MTSDDADRQERVTARSAAAGNADARLISELAWEKRRTMPDAVALYDNGIAVTYAQIVSEAEELAAGFGALGIQPGETISFQLPNWREAVAINLAAAAAGLVINPVTPIYRGAELRFILQNSRSRLIFIPDSFRSINYRTMLDELRGDLPDLQHVISVRSILASEDTEDGYEWLRSLGRAILPYSLPSVSPASNKLLLYTSGTTGTAKGVIHTHDSIDHGTMSAVDFWELAETDNMLMASPVTHITGYAFGLELPFQSDCIVTLMDRWEPTRAIELIDAHQITASIGATPFLKELVEEAARLGRNLPSLRMFACGGAAVTPELILQTARVTERCVAFRVYGATEIPLVTKGFLQAGQRALASETDGEIVGYDVRIVDADGKALGPGRVGEIRARGPAMLVDYTDHDEFLRAIDADGFFCTGDLGMVTEDNAVVVTGRLKDIIIRGGENLSPVEIERALELHPAILEAAVVSMPHPRLGEGVAAFIRAHEGAELPSLIEIADFLAQRDLAKQKFPERIEYIDDFPRTASGKVRKDRLRDALRQPLVITVEQASSNARLLPTEERS